MSDSIPPPPTYSQQDPDHVSLAHSDTTDSSDLSQHPQLLIVPTIDTVNFQKGFLGAEEERAAIEGELQIKGIDSGSWKKVTVCLRTVERAFSREIELNCSEVVLWSRSADPTATALPSSMLFAIPLMPDAPQSIFTPHSSLSHTLTASLHPTDPHFPPLSKSLNVHTRRYTSHLHSIPLSPETHSLDYPTRVEVEVPRTTFKVGEPIPIYVKIPPPRRELVIDEGLRLRNVKAELIRVVKVKQDDDETDFSENENTQDKSAGPADGASAEGLSATLAPEQPVQSSSSKAPVSPIFSGSSYRAVLARSGASCRFHSSRTVQLRFVMHRASPFSSPSDNSVNLPNSEHEYLDADSEYSSITQQTLLHSVTFRVDIHISFVDVASRTERISTVSIPITLLPPSASLPEVGPSMDEAYQKKHDRPPAQTNRYEDTDFVPHYSEGEAGPSALPNGAPPPFEERDAPPPFFSSAAEASTSAHLPTFLESEREVIIPPDPDETLAQPSSSIQTITGEGFEFGFTISEQFDGHSEDMQRSSTPPPTLEMASRDANVTQLADMAEPERAIEALGLVLTQQQDGAREEPPPPPPALDDPSDPPPSIDSDFRSPDPPRQRSPPHSSPPPLHPGYSPEPPQLHTPAVVPPVDNHESHGHAPPPYLVPENHAEHVTRPPPYVD